MSSRGFPIGVTLLVLLLAGCGASGDRHAVGRSTRVPQASDLVDSLLRQADVPRIFQITSTDSGSGPGSAGDTRSPVPMSMGPLLSGTCLARVLDALSVSMTEPPGVWAKRKFGHGSGAGSADVTVELGFYDTPMKDQIDLPPLRRLFTSCTGFSKTFEGIRWEAAVGVDRQVRISHADSEVNVGMRGTATVPGRSSPFAMSIVMVSRGHTNVTLSVSSVGPQTITSRSIDLAGVQLARLADFE